jgi:hypothetical protein
MVRLIEIEEEATPRSRHEAEIRVPTPGTWVGLGAGILVVVAGFVWTIL